jgi:hypothetical protein
MKLEHIVALAVRIFAIVLALYAIRNGVSFFTFFLGQELESVSYYYASGMFLLFVLAIILWMFPLTVARGIVKFHEPGETDLSSISDNRIQVIGFSILGLFLLFHVISDITYWSVIWLVSQRSSSFPELSLDQIAQMVATAIELVFVLFLLFGARGISKFLHKWRYGTDA